MAQQLENPPKAIFVWEGLANSTWLLTTFLGIVLTGLAPIALLIPFFTAPLFYVFVLLAFAVPYLKFRYLLPKVQNYYEDQEAAKNAVRSYERFALLSPFLHGLVMLVVSAFVFGFIDKPMDFVGIAIIVLSSICVVSAFCFYREINALETWIKDVPNFNEITFSFIFKVMSISIASIIGETLICLIPFIAEANLQALTDASGDEAAKIIDGIFFTRSIPTFVITTVITTMTMFLLVRELSARIKKVIGNISDIADGNYTGKRVSIMNRDEIGVLTAQYNKLLHFNKNFFNSVKRKPLPLSKHPKDLRQI